MAKWRKRVPRVRKPIPKELREKIYNKYGQCCAYCAVALSSIKDMQVDHIKPHINGGTDEEANLMPACRQCNNYKHFWSLEQFRTSLEDQIEILRRNSRNFRTAERYGLVFPVPNPKVVFYFEAMGITHVDKCICTECSP